MCVVYQLSEVYVDHCLTDLFLSASCLCVVMIIICSLFDYTLIIMTTLFWFIFYDEYLDRFFAFHL